MIKKLFILLAFTPFISLNIFAETSGEDIAPSNLTNVYTQAAIMVSGNRVDTENFSKKLIVNAAL